MTEQQWLNGTYLYTLIRHVDAEVDHFERKLRLFGVACCRRALDWLPDSYLADVVATAERYSDDPKESERATDLYRRYYLEGRSRPFRYSTSEDEQTEEGHYEYLIDAAHAILIDPPHVEHVPEWCTDAMCGHDDFESNHGEQLFQLDLFRDIFGNPFRPVAFDRRWRTSTAVGVAQEMYDARDFAAMPILADALQDAGCEDEAILAHCRREGPHVRGCWVVDLVLGKS